MIGIINNFLDAELLKVIMDKYESKRKQAAFEVNHFGRWGAGLESGSYAPVLILPYDELSDYFLLRYKAISPEFGPMNTCVCYMHIWLPGSQIGWHHDGDDSVQRMSSTIYLNPEWNWNYGGLFLYDHPSDGQRWIYPDYNKMIWFKPPLWHSTSMVTSHAPYPRLSIQLFFYP